MKSIAVLILTLLFSLPAHTQQVPDCSNCTSADWGREWHPQHQNCTYNPLSGCGFGCNCQMSFVSLPSDETTSSVGASGFFGGAFTKDGFRIDRVGPLARVRVQAGEVIYLLNGKRPSRAALRQFTEKQPARRVLATYNSAGRLALRLYHQ